MGRTGIRLKNSMRIALKMSNVWNRNGNVYVEMGGTEI